MMDDIIQQFRDNLENQDSSNNSISAYIYDLKKFEIWYQDTTGEIPEPGTIGALDVAEFKRHLLNRNQKPA